MATEPWEAFLTERDRAVFGASGYGSEASAGQRPVLMVIDINQDFVGDRPEPILESIQRFPNSCGQEGWEAMERLAPLLAAARATGVPVVYTTNDPQHTDLEDASWGRKNTRTTERRADHGSGLAEIPEPIAPRPGDVLIQKTKPSAFFDTPLRQYLTMWGIDTVYCCGATTSGCVRATVVDAFSHGYRVDVVRDCSFDRGEASHAISLFDLSQKYADLVTAEELRAAWKR
jgi:nicotinamidase-related amidase